MLNVQTSRTIGAVNSSDQNPAVKVVDSATTRIIEFFHKKLQDIQSFPAPAQPSNLTKHAQHRIEHLLRFAVTKEQPSLAEQISQRVENSREPLKDTQLHSDVAKLLDQTSPLDAQKTYAQLIQVILESPSPSASNVRPLLSRARRHSHEVDPAPTSRNASTPAFAKALVEREDRKLAMNLADNLINLRNAAEQGHTSNSLVAIPPDSSFGQAWGDLNDAVNAEPFKSFAAAKKIDMSNVSMDLSGTLYENRGNHVVRFDLESAEWAPASAAVLAAVKKLAGWNGIPFPLTGKSHAHYDTVGGFYALPLGAISSNDTLYSIGALLRQGNFDAFSDDDPLFAPVYDPIKRQQSDAIRRVVDLPQQQLNQRLAPFTAKTAEQKVQEADQRLAQQSNHALMKLIPDIGDDWEYDLSKVLLTDIPEYSTFNQARKNLLTALTGSTFTTFVREHNLDRSSIRIDPVTGDLTGNVNGVETHFSANDVSGWSDVWDEIERAVSNMAAGSHTPIRFPSTQSTPLSEVMNFYNEKIPYLEDYRVSDYGRLRRRAVLERSADMNQNKGFKALNSTDAADGRSTAVRASQNAIMTDLANAPIPLSPLETLAAAVVSSSGATTAPVETPEDDVATAESALATTVHHAMLELKTDATQASSKMIGPIPAGSLFGQWWGQLGKALKSRGLVEWARQQHVDPASLRFDPVGKVLIGKVNGVDQRFEADDFGKKYPDHFDVLTPVVRAAQALVPNGKSIMLSYTGESRAPYELVANFYGIDNGDYSSARFAGTTALMGRTQRFPERTENPEQSLDQLRRQKTALGDSNDRYALIGQLNRGAFERDETQDAARFVVDPDSSHRQKGVKTARAFIAENGWKVPEWKADYDNLLLALRTPVPQPAPLRNNWGFLATDVSLSTAQREAVAGFVTEHIGSLNTSFRFMGNRVTNLSADPAQALEQLLSSNDAIGLANHLQSQMKGVATPTSLKQWLLTAMVLHLDPTAGTQSNTVAGYDFMKPGNWGRPAKEILQDLTQHLVASNKVQPAHAPAAAYVLASGTAPQFLVKDMPDSLIIGTRQWVHFHTAVNRIEQIAPGATRNMTYQKVMDFNAVKPVSDAETQQLSRAQMNPITDWGIVNGIILKGDKRPYIDQLKDCIQALSKQNSEVAAARQYINRNPVPVRRALALKNLQEKFGNQIPYEENALWRVSNDTSLYPTRASVVEAYEAGQLGITFNPVTHEDFVDKGGNSTIWESRNDRIPIQRMHDNAGQLPDVNKQYDAAFENDCAPRRRHSIVLIKDLLTRLPAEDRNRLAYGNLEYFTVQEMDSNPLPLVNSKTGKKGPHGIIIRATSNDGKTSDIGIFPGAGVAKILPGLPNPMPIGGSNANFGLSAIGKDEGAHELPLDFTAFSSPAAPRDGITSFVIVDRMPRLVAGEMITNTGNVTFGTVNQNTAPAYFNAGLENIAATLVDSHFLRKDESKAFNHGHNHLEHKPRTFLEGLHALVRMIPGVTPLEDLYEGHYADAGRDLFFDALSIVIPGALGKVWKFAASSLERAAVKVGEELGESVAEKLADKVAFGDVSTSRASTSFKAINRMQGDLPPVHADGSFAATPDLANGAVSGSSITDPLKATAIRRGENWYAFDAKTQQPYGPALENFVSETSSGVQKETFSDGTQALVTEKNLSADAYTVPRSTGFDLVDGGKVYRYERRTPGVLVDLESADRFKPLEGFDAICPIPAVPGRLRRASNDTCFSKVIKNVSETSGKELQALEHQRLFPSKTSLLKNEQFVIFERRKYKMVDGETGPQLIPTLDGKRITYKPEISGSLKDDPSFGFLPEESTDAVTRNTRVVKLDSISDAVKDTRELRGVVVNRSSKNYLIIEADTAEFYYADLGEARGGKLNFKKCTPGEFSMVREYRDAFVSRQGTALASFDANFIALPKLDVAFEELERSGITKEDVDEIKSWCKDLAPEQQREVLYQLQRSNAIGKADIALRPNQVSTLTKPEGFITWTTQRQNEFYARQAKESATRSMTATGLGHGNVIRSNADKARAEAASRTLGWLRGCVAKRPRNYATLLVKTGAGNCGEMAALSKDIIEKSGGRAYEWAIPGSHAFTVVGGPSTLPAGSVNFSEAAWADAWIVDPWANIACPAREYTQQLSNVMHKWAQEGVKIIDENGPTSPIDPAWLKGITSGSKAPSPYAYQS